MFDRFTNDAKQAMSQARLAAIRLGHDYIGPEHLLLGVLAVPGCSANDALSRLAVSPSRLHAAVTAALVPAKLATTTGQLPFSPEAKHVLERTLEVMNELGHGHLGTEHLLLALATEPGVTARAFAEARLDPGRLRLSLMAASSSSTIDRGAVRALLISNSTMHGGEYLSHCAAEIRDFLGARHRVLFVPYALADHDGYASKARAAFAAFGQDLVSAHEGSSPIEQLHDCTAVFIGGGNTFRLLNTMYRTGMIAAIRARCLAGMPYIGSSAGTNVATLSIRTTNDMPIVMPPAFEALQLVPFQINPHYLDPDPASKHMGETREERLRQFHEESDVPVLALREGCMLRVEGTTATLRGTTNARLFRRGEAPVEFTPPCDLSMLLRA